MFIFILASAGVSIYFDMRAMKVGCHRSFQDSLSFLQTFDENFYKSLKEYSEQDEERKVKIDHLQSWYQCCAADGFYDYLHDDDYIRLDHNGTAFE